MLPYFADAEVYQSNFVNGTPNVSVAASENTIRFFPILIGYERSYNTLACDILVAAASSNIRLGLYEIDGNGSPTVKIADSGEISTATTGNKIAAITPVLLEQGFYYGAIWGSHAINMRGWTAGAMTGSGMILEDGVVTLFQGIYRPLAWDGSALPTNELGQQHLAITGSALLFALR